MWILKKTSHSNIYALCWWEPLLFTIYDVNLANIQCSRETIISQNMICHKDVHSTFSHNHPHLIGLHNTPSTSMLSNSKNSHKYISPTGSPPHNKREGSGFVRLKIKTKTNKHLLRILLRKHGKAVSPSVSQSQTHIIEWNLAANATRYQSNRRHSHESILISSKHRDFH